jgi:hypothetical protein
VASAIVQHARRDDLDRVVDAHRLAAQLDFVQRGTRAAGLDPFPGTPDAERTP